MKALLALGLGALVMHVFTRSGVRRSAVRTELEPDRPSETPQGAQHLGR